MTCWTELAEAIMLYRIILSPRALADAAVLRKSEPPAYRKLLKLIEELEVHPRTGTGHPEPLKGQPEGRWSRRLTKKHRLVYRICDEEVLVEVLMACGHYDDK